MSRRPALVVHVAGSAGCPHCGAKFVKRPAAPVAAPAPAEPAEPVKSESDQMWGDEPQAKTVEAPPGAGRPAARPPMVPRRGRVINTGRPSTVGTSAIADHAKTLGGVAVAILVIAGFGLRVWLRSSARSGATPTWQTVEDDDHVIEPGKFAGGTIDSAITKGQYVLEVRVMEGTVGVAMRAIAGEKITKPEAAALMLSLKKVEKGRTEVLSGQLDSPHYAWVVMNTDDNAPSKVHVLLKGGGR